MKSQPGQSTDMIRTLKMTFALLATAMCVSLTPGNLAEGLLGDFFLGDLFDLGFSGQCLGFSGQCYGQEIADQWGHWRGPTGNGTSATAKPPKEFSQTKGLKWKVPIAGQGSGSPVVWDQRVWVTSAVPSGSGNEFEFRV